MKNQVLLKEPGTYPISSAPPGTSCHLPTHLNKLTCIPYNALLYWCSFSTFAKLHMVVNSPFRKGMKLKQQLFKIFQTMNLKYNTYTYALEKDYRLHTCTQKCDNSHHWLVKSQGFLFSSLYFSIFPYFFLTSSIYYLCSQRHFYFKKSIQNYNS